jgi:hypothetical protein
MTSNSSSSSLVAPERSYTFCCVQCHAVGSPETKFLRCSRCKFVRYCDANCQKLHFASHKPDCRNLKAIREYVARNPSDFFILGSLQFQLAYRYSETILQSKYLYGQALDSYMEQYETIRSKENFSVHEIVPLRSRIPFLLAALGHDELAIRETERCIMRWSRGERSNDLSVYSDLIKQGMHKIPKLFFASWPKCFLLPVLLVKLKVVLDLRHQESMLNEYKLTDAGRKLEGVVTVVRDFFMHSLSDQTDQMLFVLDLVENGSDNEQGVSFLDFSHNIDPLDDEAYIPEIFGEVHEDDPLTEFEYLFVRDAFQENPQVQAIVDAERGPASQRRWRSQSRMEKRYFRSLFTIE